MSRIGKHPVVLGQGVQATIADGNIVVKGPKGEIKMHVLAKVGIELKDGALDFTQLRIPVSPTPTWARCALSSMI